MSFQENLRYYREKAGYSTKTFSDLLNLPYATYAGYEYKNREPKYNLLCKIADLLDVTTDELLGRENNILGKKEDERLKKELDEILAMPTKFLKLQDMNDDYVTFQICGKDENYIWHTFFLKKEVIDMINKTKSKYAGMINADIYKNLILDALNKAISDRQTAVKRSRENIQELEASNSTRKDPKIFEETQIMNSTLETLNELQKVKTIMTAFYSISEPLLEATKTMLKSFQQQKE